MQITKEFLESVAQDFEIILLDIHLLYHNPCDFIFLMSGIHNPGVLVINHYGFLVPAVFSIVNGIILRDIHL